MNGFTGRLIVPITHQDFRQSTYRYLFVNDRGIDITTFDVGSDVFYTVSAKHGVKFTLDRPYASDLDVLPPAQRDTPYTPEFNHWYLESNECRVDDFFGNLLSHIRALPHRQKNSLHDIIQLPESSIPQFSNFATGMVRRELQKSLYPLQATDPPVNYEKLEKYADGFEKLSHKLTDFNLSHVNSKGYPRFNSIIQYRALVKKIEEVRKDKTHLPTSAVLDWLTTADAPSLFKKLLAKNLG